MTEFHTADGRYLLVEQGDGNAVVYDRGVAVWDRWSAEAGASSPAPSPQPTPLPDSQPQPSGRTPIRVTDGWDGELVNRMYSYWSNAWVTGDTAWVFVGHIDGRPRLFKVDLGSGHVERVNWILPYSGTTEGWYWKDDGRIYLLKGPQLRLANPFTGDEHVVFDISDTHPGCDLWQAHSSDDGQTHSATVRQIVSEGKYPYIGTVVVRHGRQEFFKAHGTLDESQITPDGEDVVIKETPDGAERVSNRIINLATRETRTLTNAQGAVGHSDVGPGLLVGEWSPGAGVSGAGACVLWDLRQPLVPERRRELFKTWNMGHVSIRGRRILISDDTSLSLVQLLDEGGSTLTHLLSHGGGIANLSPCGRVGCYMANGIVYLLVLPS